MVATFSIKSKKKSQVFLFEQLMTVHQKPLNRFNASKPVDYVVVYLREKSDK